MRTTYQRFRWQPVVWGIGIALAIAYALQLAWQEHVRTIRADERAAVLAEGDTIAKLAIARGYALSRLVDSLRIEAAHRDTVVLHTIERAKAEVAKPLPPVSDTVGTRIALQSCRSTLDTLATACAQFRATATAALAAAAQQHTTDTTRMRVQAEREAAITRSRDAALAQLASKSSWKSFERGVCAASVVGNLIQWRTR